MRLVLVMMAFGMAGCAGLSEHPRTGWSKPAGADQAREVASSGGQWKVQFRDNDGGRTVATVLMQHRCVGDVGEVAERVLPETFGLVFMPQGIIPVTSRPEAIDARFEREITYRCRSAASSDL